MSVRLSEGVFRCENSPKIESFASIAGGKEGKGPLGHCFDRIVEDSHFGEETWEKAESKFQLETVSLSISKGNLTKDDIDVIFSGDLINQCIGSTYGLRELEIPYLGIYGACSTMAEGILLATILTDSCAVNRAAAVTFVPIRTVTVLACHDIGRIFENEIRIFFKKLPCLFACNKTFFCKFRINILVNFICKSHCSAKISRCSGRNRRNDQFFGFFFRHDISAK